jgi:hypothetical protein
MDLQHEDGDTLPWVTKAMFCTNETERRWDRNFRKSERPCDRCVSLEASCRNNNRRYTHNIIRHSVRLLTQEHIALGAQSNVVYE